MSHINIIPDSLNPHRFSYRANGSVDDTISLALHVTLQHLDQGLYSLYTYDCLAKQSNNRLIEFADYTTMIGLISSSDSSKLAYREEDNNLTLNISKTKEVIVNCRKGTVSHSPITINGEDAESSGPTIRKPFFKKGKQRLYPLRVLWRCGMSTQMLVNFYRSIIESVLTGGISVSNKTGILGWRSEKTELVNGYETKVYGASNVELITRTRTDHLSDQNKTKTRGGKTPLQSFLGIAEQHVGPNNGALVTHMSCPAVTNPAALTAEEYFNPSLSLAPRDIGHPCQLTTKTQRFKAKLWLCESHPLSLAEQVAPIIDLMAISNALFAKLRDFITLRLPPGFPVKIEIPIYHILNARITFSNLNGCEEGGTGVRGGDGGEPVEGDGQRDTPSIDTPSPGSDSSSVSSSSSTSETHTHMHACNTRQ
ncbi:Ankyrin repeat domain-containing protein 13B [Merluccius polli]|uniref:Ankyrin repeat domain-containing protein 13B n=1 Tax=Merluccius polli TaxID=89951 RepID=A0AA47NLI7_MERPO|nr:Ankyrin repeat domain-containing protein 13B [Merluccius polli]